jgi:hypothetical protein
MTKENKLPEVGKRIVERLDIDISDRRGLKHEWMSIDEDIKEQLKDEWIQIICEEIPEQEPTIENHIPDAGKKVDEVQEAKEALQKQCIEPLEAHPRDWHNFFRLCYLSLGNKAQNLINALDAQENSKKIRADMIKKVESGKVFLPTDKDGNIHIIG